MNIDILLFATLKDRAGKAKLQVTLPQTAPTVADVRSHLSTQHPALAANLSAAIAAVNREFAQNDQRVQEGDEVAFFPPVSGGDHAPYPQILRLADQPLDLDALLAEITVPATGAVCVFSGMVRGETHTADTNQHTDHLEYEAYEPMALAKMAQVADEIRAQWPNVQGIAIVQRVGRLSVGQNTILIACASAHRDGGCFEGARYGIDRLKQIVPVWKKEIGTDGATWIEGSYQPTADDNHR
jgi:MoaE-MoaD fusion protein